MIGGDQPGDEGRGRGAESARYRDIRAHDEGEGRQRATSLVRQPFHRGQCQILAAIEQRSLRAAERDRRPVRRTDRSSPRSRVPRASPRASNPGPRLADEAGVLTVKRIGESLLQRGKLGRDANRPVRSRPRRAVDVAEVVGGDRVGVLEDVPGQERDRGFV